GPRFGDAVVEGFGFGMGDALQAAITIVRRVEIARAAEVGGGTESPADRFDGAGSARRLVNAAVIEVLEDVGELLVVGFAKDIAEPNGLTGAAVLGGAVESVTRPDGPLVIDHGVVVSGSAREVAALDRCVRCA